MNMMSGNTAEVPTDMCSTIQEMTSGCLFDGLDQCSNFWTERVCHVLMEAGKHLPINILEKFTECGFTGPCDCNVDEGEVCLNDRTPDIWNMIKQGTRDQTETCNQLREL